MARRSLRLGALLIAAGTMAAACGSDDDDSSSDATTTAAAVATTASGAAESTSSAVTSTPSSGSSTGSAGSTADGAGGEGIVFSESSAHKADVDRTGETIKIGVSNDEGGAFSLPEFRIGIEEGAKYINDHGGINGAQIEIVKCLSDASPEGAVNCANQFVEEKVDLATYGIEVAIDAAIPIYGQAGIPLITPAAYGTAQRTDPNSTVIGSAAGAYAVWPLQAFKDLGATDVAFIAENQPSSPNFIDLLNKWAPELGVKIVSTTLVDPGNPDYTAAVQTGMSKGATVIWNFTTEPGCIAFVTAIDQLAYDGVAMAGACSQYISALGEKSVGTLNLIDSYFPDVAAAAPANIQANLKAYEEAMKAAGQDQYINGFATLSFSFMQDLKTLLETIPEGPIDAASITKAADTDQDLPSFNAADFNCGAKVWPAEPAYCRAGLLILEVVDKDGELIREPLSKENNGYFYDAALAEKSASL
jgi:branched-chain amino acid transport system substrate-binding protein